MGLVIYSDFGSPGAYLASRRADALGAAGVQVDWRAVEADPRAPVGGVPLTPAEREQLARELASLGDLLLPGESLPSSPPGARLNTAAAVAAYAEACGAGVADEVRRLLFSAYWERGADIGNPEVLRRLLAGPFLRSHSTSVPLREFGMAVTSTRGPITGGAARRIRDWATQWELLNEPAAAVPLPLPILVVDGALPVTGETALRRLEKAILHAGAEVDPALPDPGRYPPVSDPPALTWVSAIGGSWRYSYLAS